MTTRATAANANAIAACEYTLPVRSPTRAVTIVKMKNNPMSATPNLKDRIESKRLDEGAYR